MPARSLPLLHGGRMVGIDGAIGGLRGYALDSAGVHGVAQFLGWFEERHALGGHVDALPGLGVAADAGVALARTEAAKAANLNFSPALSAPMTDSKRVSTMISPSRRVRSPRAVTLSTRSAFVIVLSPCIGMVISSLSLIVDGMQEFRQALEEKFPVEP